MLTFRLGGNEVLVLAVDDDELSEDAEDYDPKTKMVLCDGAGRRGLASLCAMTERQP